MVPLYGRVRCATKEEDPPAKNAALSAERTTSGELCPIACNRTLQQRRIAFDVRLSGAMIRGKAGLICVS